MTTPRESLVERLEHSLATSRARSMRDHLIGIAISHLVVILAGLFFFELDAHEFHRGTTAVLICLLAVVKTAFFLIIQVARILAMAKREFGYHHFLLLLSVNILLVIISFGVDYGCLDLVDGRSFRGLAQGEGGIAHAFQFLALSIFVFSNVGPVGVEPATVPAQLVVMVESLLSFVTIIVFLSDFMSLRESIVRDLTARTSEEGRAD